MKTMKNSKLARNLTVTAVALGLAAGATAAEAAKFTRGSVSPTIVDQVTPDLQPTVQPQPQPQPGPWIPGPFFPVTPSVTAQLKGGGKTLKVVGDNSANDVEIKIDDTGANKVHVYEDGNLIGSFPSSPMTKIQLILKGGDDKYWVGLASGASHKFTKDIDIKLGGGDDEGFVEFRGTTSNTIVQGSLDVYVNGGAGDDEVIAHFARKHGGKLAFKCAMTNGNDECSANMWGDITGGADVSFDLRGGGGDDDLWSWNTYDQYQGGYANIRIAGDATFSIRMDGGGGIDDLTPTYAGEADGDLTLYVNGKGDADMSYGVVNLGNSSSGEVSLLTLGSGGNDDLRLDVTGTTPYYGALINGGGGTDICQSTGSVVKTNCP